MNFNTSLYCKYYKNLWICILDEDVEIELVEEEAPFLAGVGGRGGLELSPVKIVKVYIKKNI